jgi:uncharacterized protein (DUF433 family)
LINFRPNRKYWFAVSTLVVSITRRAPLRFMALLAGCGPDEPPFMDSHEYDYRNACHPAPSTLVGGAQLLQWSRAGPRDTISAMRHMNSACGAVNGGIMAQFTRITLDPAVMGGKACIRGLRVTVGTVIGLLAAGRSREEILKAYPYLEAEDIEQALAYAAWRLEERELSLGVE